MNKIEWKQNSRNMVLQGDGFYISYNPNVRSNFIGWIVDIILRFFLKINKASTGEETALIKEEIGNRKFYLLNGDFRKEYEKLVLEGFDACYKFFLTKEKEKGSVIDKKIKELKNK